MQRYIRRNLHLLIGVVVISCWLFLPLIVTAQFVGPPDEDDELLNPPGPLLLEDVPLPDLTGIVTNMDAAIALGKALFWDMQLGSDNLACASCHYHAGADNRTKNQLSPGLLRVQNPSRTSDPDVLFGDNAGLTGSGSVAGPNYDLKAQDFPFHRLADMEDRNSAIIYSTNDVVSSQGSFGGFLLLDDPNRFPDFCGRPESEIFEVNGVPVRKVEPRNTPTVINAIFNHRNFWDGRANNVFNGVDPFGPRNQNARLIVLDVQNVGLEQMLLANASLASQAVGPPLSTFEMACEGRTFADLGKGILPLRALGGYLGGNIGGSLNGQFIHPSDSVLGTASGYRDDDGYGLNLTYAEFIPLAFTDRYHAATGYFEIIDQGGQPALIQSTADKGYTQMEHNFSMFFGIALMLYQSTLVSNQTPYDAFIAANPGLTNTGEGSLIAQADTVELLPNFGRSELLGLDVFMNKGKCYACHNGPEFSSASVRARGFDALEPEPIEFMPTIEPNWFALYDGGFYNIGVRTPAEDLGVGGGDPFGYPLSFSRQLSQNTAIDFVIGPIDQQFIGMRTSVDGAMKTPTIRNVELTGPYMHSGGLSTLRQVVEFYDRGGDRRDVNRTDCVIADTTGFGDAGDRSQCTNLHPALADPLNLTNVEVQALVAFMLALTDPRVKNESAPFDHPELRIPNGHLGDQFSVAAVAVNPVDPGNAPDVRAADAFRLIPAVGAAGRSVAELPPIRPFLNLNPFSLGQNPAITPVYIPLLLDN